MINYDYTIWILILPLSCFLLLSFWGKKYFKSAAGTIATIVLGTTTLLSLFTAYQYFFVQGITNGSYPQNIAYKFNWLEFYPGVSIDMGIVIDPIAVMMLVVVTFVSLMVHLFSLWYMKGEERFSTYYAYLSLFTFSMLGLIVSTNIFQLYMFWELVGVSSFLLIGYYFTKPSAVAAAKKAFIVTRFADFGFLIGILILGFNANSLDISLLIDRLSDTQSAEYLTATAASFLGISALTWGLILVFIGGAGKSAMFPLHIWLPDAMEGPTPVSALIHAATMVVAGVYLVARLFGIYAIDETALNLVAYTGIISAVFAAIIACTQTDIKRVLAYSTMSQIGYMMFALGVSGHDGENGLGYTASMFHLFTHAFFKSLLFLGAGAVIHAVHSNDLADMGGLRKKLPITHITFLIACLAIAGVPPFAGFFSKEEILLAAQHKSQMIYLLALITSGITAFYMFRLYFSIFWNSANPKQLHGEGNFAMKVPLILLAVLSLGAGFIPFSNFVTPDLLPQESHFDITFSILPVSLGLLGIFAAARLYKTKNTTPDAIVTFLGGLYTTVYKKFYIDEIYLFITKKIIFGFFGKPAAWIDKNIIDGGVNLTGLITEKIAVAIKGLQSGKVQQYAMVFFTGILILVILFIYGW